MAHLLHIIYTLFLGHSLDSTIKNHLFVIFEVLKLKLTLFAIFEVSKLKINFFAIFEVPKIENQLLLGSEEKE